MQQFARRPPRPNGWRTSAALAVFVSWSASRRILRLRLGMTQI